jgi:hypothetical protein
VNAAACAKFIDLTKEDPSREWDSASAAALCTVEGSKKATANFLVNVSVLVKSPGALAADKEKSALEMLLAGLGGSATKSKFDSKYQIK